MSEQAENASSTLRSHLRVSLHDTVRGNLPTGQNLDIAPDHRLRPVGKGTCLDLFTTQEPERRTEEREHGEKVCYRYTGWGQVVR